MGLVPTVMVKLESAESRWEPRRLIHGNAGSSFGWQAAFSRETETDSLESEHEVPGEIIVGGSIERLPEELVVESGGGRSEPVRPGARGGYPCALPVAPTNLANPRASRLGSVELVAQFDSIEGLALGGDGPTASSPSLRTSAPAGDAFTNKYTVDIPVEQIYAEALEQGYNQLETLYTASSILASAGASAVTGSGSLVRTFVIETAKGVAEEGAQEFAISVTTEIVRGVTDEGEEIEDFAENTDPTLREGFGEARIAPPTPELRDMVTVDDLDMGNGHNEFGDEDEITEVGIGFSGPLIEVQGTRTARADVEAPVLPAREAATADRSSPRAYTLTVTDSTGTEIGSTTVRGTVSMDEFGERVMFGTLGDFEGDGDRGIADNVRVAGGDVIEDWSVRDLDDYTQTQDGGGEFEVVSAPTASGSSALEMRTGRTWTRYTSRDPLVPLEPGMTVRGDLRHETDVSSSYAMQTSFAVGVDSEGNGGLHATLVNPGRERTPGARLGTPDGNSRIEFTPDTGEFYTFDIDIAGSQQ